MKYYKMCTYVAGGEDYETVESLIDDITFRQYKQAFLEGASHIVMDNKIIKTSSIKEILPADDVVEEYIKMGVSLKSIGLPERAKLPEGFTKDRNVRLEGLKKFLVKNNGEQTELEQSET